MKSYVHPNPYKYRTNKYLSEIIKQIGWTIQRLLLVLVFPQVHYTSFLHYTSIVSCAIKKVVIILFLFYISPVKGKALLTWQQWNSKLPLQSSCPFMMPPTDHLLKQQYAFLVQMVKSQPHCVHGFYAFSNDKLHSCVCIKVCVFGGENTQ